MEIDARKNGIERDLCIVLRTAAFKEADLMVTFLSRSQGRIDARAYGARSVKSPIRAACQLFCVSDFEFYVRNDRWSVKAADIRLDLSGLQDDFKKYACGSVMLELTEKMTKGAGDAELSELFTLLVTSLSVLEVSQEDPIYILLFFYARAVNLLGIFPSLRTCVRCGAPVRGSHRWSCVEGGIVCDSCAEQSELPELSDDVLSCLRTFGRAPEPESEQDLSHRPPIVRSAVSVLQELLENQLGIHVRSLRMVRG